MSDDTINKLQDSLAYIRKKTTLKPQTAIILGSGLGRFADLLTDKIKIPTDQIPHYPASTVEGHAGFLVFGALKNMPVLAVQGRTHYYEGYDILKVTYVIRLLAAMRIRLLIVTNAAGSVNSGLQPGDLMLITDQVNHMFQNPLRGFVSSEEKRFPDMSNPYSSELHPMVEEIAWQEKVPLKRGVLLASTGPSYETAAEIRMVRKFSVDAVSMSTVPEVIVAQQEGIKVLGISCITNLATGVNNKSLDHEEVTQTALKVQDKFINLVSGIIGKLEQY